MDKQELDAKIEEIAKALLSYCSARTSNYFEAEDLAQDIILEIYKYSIPDRLVKDSIFASSPVLPLSLFCNHSAVGDRERIECADGNKAYRTVSGEHAQYYISG